MLLLLTRTAGGRTWRLADTCHACATATAHAAVVSEEPPRPRTAARQQRPAPALLWTTDGVSPDEEAPPWVEEALYD